MIKHQILEALYSALNIVKQYNSFSIGDLINVVQLSEKQPSILEDRTLSSALAQFLLKIYEESRASHRQIEKLGILTIQSIFYNLYRHLSPQKLSNSLYNNSFLISCTSQISMTQQSFLSNANQVSYQAPGALGTVLEDFISENKLMNKLQVMAQKCNKKGENFNQRYVEILLATIEYILEKEGKIVKGKGDFYNFKKNIVSPSLGSHPRNLKNIIETVNSVIFSQKLNRILFMLEGASQQIYFSLLRIYSCQIQEFQSYSHEKQVGKKKSKKFDQYFLKIKHRGQQMLQNIFINYIASIQNSKQLFAISKNPFYLLISHYFVCFFTPIFRQFTQIVLKCCKIEYKDKVQFYRRNESILSKQLVEFIEFLPSDFTSYLKILYQLCKIQESNATQVITIEYLTKKEPAPKMSALISIKKLLLYSFLAKADNIKLFIPDSVSPQKYAQACTYIINLFFHSSLKCPTNQELTPSQYQIVSTLTITVSTTIDKKIKSQQQQQFYIQDEFQTVNLNNYLLEEPILNYDYELIFDLVSNLEFSPKDERDFEMKSVKEIQSMYIQVRKKDMSSNTQQENTEQPYSFSPMQKYKRENQIESIQIFDSPQEEDNQIDFLTWMSVGGTRNYKQAPSSSQFQLSQHKNKEKRIKEKVTFSKQNMKQIKNFYSNYSRLAAGNLH